MPKKRTKLQKIKAQYHYALPSTHSFSGIEVPLKLVNKAANPAQRQNDITSLYSYDPKFITEDLMKTLTVSSIIIIIQIILYMGWK